jgi:Family of unknown function (DUF6011)
MLAKPINADDLNDPLPWDGPSEGERPLPQDDASVRIRASTPAFQMVACPRCAGSGMTRWGQCFKCRGSRTVKQRVFKTAPEERARKRAGRLDRKERRGHDHVEAFKSAHPDHWQWIERTIARTDDKGEGSFGAMIRDLPEAIRKYGDLSPGRMAMIERGIARDAEHDAFAEVRKQEAVARSVEVDTAKIEAAFARMREAGKKRIALHYAGLYISPMRNDVTALRVKAARGYDATYYGKIQAGRFFPVRDCPEEIKGRLALIAADPAAAARVDGIETGICCCCGAELTDPVSIAAGIGPICAGNWGF